MASIGDVTSYNTCSKEHAHTMPFVVSQLSLVFIRVALLITASSCSTAEPFNRMIFRIILRIFSSFPLFCLSGFILRSEV